MPLCLSGFRLLWATHITLEVLNDGCGTAEQAVNQWASNYETQLRDYVPDERADSVLCCEPAEPAVNEWASNDEVLCCGSAETVVIVSATSETPVLVQQASVANPQVFEASTMQGNPLIVIRLESTSQASHGKLDDVTIDGSRDDWLGTAVDQNRGLLSPSWGWGRERNIHPPRDVVHDHEPWYPSSGLLGTLRGRPPDMVRPEPARIHTITGHGTRVQVCWGHHEADHPTRSGQVYFGHISVYFGSIFGLFWAHFGVLLGPFPGPFSAKNSSPYQNRLFRKGRSRRQNLPTWHVVIPD